MLFRIFLAIYACFASFLRNGYTRTININSDEIPDELIYHFNISNSFIKENSEVPERCCDFDFTMFCKDNVCVHLEEKIIKPFIELPDKNGYVHRYILEPYAHSYGNFILEYNESNNNDTMFLLNVNLIINVFQIIVLIILVHITQKLILSVVIIYIQNVLSFQIVYYILIVVEWLVNIVQRMRIVHLKIVKRIKNVLRKIVKECVLVFIMNHRIVIQ